MADYTVQIDGDSFMMIRDTGGWVEFWFRTGSQTWNNDQPWAYAANGHSSGTLEFRLLRGGNWQKFGAVFVSYDQDVTFAIYSAGSFPTHFFVQHITRSTVPSPPRMLSATPLSTTTIRGIFTGTHDGGSPVLEWHLGYGSSPNGPGAAVVSDGNTDVGGFTSGQRVYFWARGRNAKGWSAWSNRVEATTWKVPGAPSVVGFTNVKQMSLTTSFKDGSNGGTPILQRQVAYGKDPVTYETLVDSPTNGVNNISGLDAGKTYYFWVRSRNVVGWGPWSARSMVNLIAGARVRHAATWARAVPYVRVDGVWKVARPMVRHAGVWKETSI